MCAIIFPKSGLILDILLTRYPHEIIFLIYSFIFIFVFSHATLKFASSLGDREGSSSDYPKFINIRPSLFIAHASSTFLKF